MPNIYQDDELEWCEGKLFLFSFATIISIEVFTENSCQESLIKAPG